MSYKDLKGEGQLLTIGEHQELRNKAYKLGVTRQDTFRLRQKYGEIAYVWAVYHSHTVKKINGRIKD